MSSIQRNYIAGAWWEGAGVMENRSPSGLNDLIGLYAIASSEDVADACVAAAEAQVAWAAVGPQLRADVLSRIARGIEKRETEIATMLAARRARSFPRRSPKRVVPPRSLASMPVRR